MSDLEKAAWMALDALKNAQKVRAGEGDTKHQAPLEDIAIWLLEDALIGITQQAEPVVERKPLTKAELQDLLTAIDPENVKRLPHGFYLFARAIEKAHGIGEEE